MPQFIVLRSYWGDSDTYECEARCTGRRLPIAEVKQRALDFTGRTSYAHWSEGPDAIVAGSWLYCWYQVKQGDTITLSSEDWQNEELVRKQLIVTVPDGGLPHPPSTLEESRSYGQDDYYGRVSRGEPTTVEVVGWGTGGVRADFQFSADQCAVLTARLAEETGVAPEHIHIDADRRVVTLHHGTPLTAQETLLRQFYQALQRMDRRWYPVKVNLRATS